MTDCLQELGCLVKLVITLAMAIDNAGALFVWNSVLKSTAIGMAIITGSKFVSAATVLIVVHTLQ